jgi:hypothetical protein
MAADLRTAIDAVKHDGRQHMATCPAHEDGTASLCVGRGDKGGIVLSCMAGCATEDVLDRAGLTYQDVMPPTTTTSKRRIVATYDYTDRAGALLYQVVRYSPKDFRQRKPNGAGGWTWKLGAGVHRVLFGLPELTNKRGVFIVEGEKDVLALRALGFVATCNAGGAGKWLSSYAAQLLAARVESIIILPDNDDPGRQHAIDVARSCTATGLDARIVELPGLPPKGDVSDWIANGGTADALRALVADALATPTPAAATPSLAVMLADVRDTITKYVHMTTAQATTAALWAAHTHAIDAAEATPYLQVTSATPEAGKTRLLEVLECLVSRPWFTGRCSAAVLVRKIDAEQPTMLLDESDAAFKGEKDYAEALRGILNSGYRKSGKASLCVGQGKSIEYRDFSVFGPKAIAGIGKLPDTVASRAIKIELKRRTKDEPVAKFRERDAKPAAEPLAVALSTWAAGAVPELCRARPVMPDGLRDRSEDVWEPLLAIADLAGEDWPMLARQAAVDLCGSVVVETDIATALLGDCRDVFGDEASIRSTALRDKLIALEEHPWASFGKADKPITVEKLAALLRKFGIRSTHTSTGNTYRRAAFVDAWSRYLPPNPSPLHNANVYGGESTISALHPDIPNEGMESPKTPMFTGESEGVKGSTAPDGKSGADDADPGGRHAL